MQFAFPPRKAADTTAYSRPSRMSSFRRKRLKQGAVIACGALSIIFLIYRLFSSKPPMVYDRIPTGAPEVVIVTVLDPSMSEEYVATVKENRQDYAKRHGYEVFLPSSTDYELGSSPKSWALLPALRQAMAIYRHSTYFFSLSPHSLIMNSTLSLTGHVMDSAKLDTLMLKDKPVVPPDSVIHTFSHIQGDKVDLVLTQDGEGLCQESFILRRGEWANFFLDVWFDPLYRSYNFQKAEGHALEHVVQWHPTVLTKLALVPVRTINSYTVDIASRGGKAVTYQDGDFVVRAVGCERDQNRKCEGEMKPWFLKWKSQFGQA